MTKGNHAVSADEKDASEPRELSKSCALKLITRFIVIGSSFVMYGIGKYFS